MQNELYPVFEIPTAALKSAAATEIYKPAPCFDFERGDFVRDGANRVVMVDGREAYREWVLKMLNTPHGACAAYPRLGLDYEGATAEVSIKAAQATFERVITECLLRHPMTQRVRDFQFASSGNELEISFTVQGKNQPAFPVRFITRR